MDMLHWTDIHDRSCPFPQWDRNPSSTLNPTTYTAAGTAVQPLKPFSSDLFKALMYAGMPPTQFSG